MDKKETIKDMADTMTGVQQGDSGWHLNPSITIKLAEALHDRGYGRNE